MIPSATYQANIVTSLPIYSSSGSFSTSISSTSPAVSPAYLSISSYTNSYNSDVILNLDDFTNLNVQELSTVTLPIDLT